MYSILSIALGLLAWGLGIAAIINKGTAVPVFSSMAACGCSLVVQFFEMRCQALAEDASWFYDVAPTLAMVAGILLAVTVGLNLAALWRGKRG